MLYKDMQRGTKAGGGVKEPRSTDTTFLITKWNTVPP